MTALWLLLLLSMVAVGLGADGGTSEGGEQEKGQTDTEQTSEEDELGRKVKNEEGTEKYEEEETGEYEGDPNTPLNEYCCMGQKVMPIFFPIGIDKCQRFMNNTNEDEEKKEGKEGAADEEGKEGVEKEKVAGGQSAVGDKKGVTEDGKSAADGAMIEDDSECLLECMMKANGLLDGSKSFKEPALRNMLDHVNEDVKVLLHAALDKCLPVPKEKDEKEKEGVKSTTCERSLTLFACITKHFNDNCPARFWRVYIRRCHANMPKSLQGAAALDEEFY